MLKVNNKDNEKAQNSGVLYSIVRLFGLTSQETIKCAFYIDK